MRALDLCAGAGGLSLGLQRAGFDVLGIELDLDAIETHRRHVGPCEQADLRTYHPADRFDLTAGGVPCQPFSAAGLGLGIDDPRYLVPDFLRIAREAGSSAVLLENVRGLVLKPKAFRAVLDAFEAEWLTTWTVVDAADYGVPQHRDRLFVVGFKDAAARARFRWPQPTHAPPGSMFWAPYRTVREALSLGDAPHRSGLKECAKSGSPQGMRLLNVERLSEALGGLDSPAPTIKTRVDEGRDGDRPSRRPLGELNHAVRLSAAQCAALQGFPAGWTFTGNKAAQHCQIGNAVPPALAEAMGLAMRAALLG